MNILIRSVLSGSAVTNAEQEQELMSRGRDKLRLATGKGKAVIGDEVVRSVDEATCADD